VSEQQQVVRGFLANVDVVPPLIVTFQFNPASVSDNKSVLYKEVNDAQGSIAPGRKYLRGGDRMISFDLQLHGLEQGSDRLNKSPVANGVSTELAKLRSFLYPAASAWGTLSGLFGTKLGTIVTSPPTCVFGFGAKVVECVVADLRIDETQFNSALAPVRADVGVSLVVLEDDGNLFYQYDKQMRNLQAALGLQNIRIF
jgi:hypothetical protein